MLDQLLSPLIFRTQAEAFSTFEMKRDFVWWAKTLVKEEAAELKEADEKNMGMEAILKELGDLIYVLVGFYNCTPLNANALVSEETNQEIEAIYIDAMETLTGICQKFKINQAIVEKSFMLVHESNMTKVDPDKGVIRRSDGKVLKGKNYKAPDMKPAVDMWESFVRELRRTGQNKTTREMFDEMTKTTIDPKMVN